MDEGGPGEGRGASVNKELRLLCTQRAEPTPPAGVLRTPTRTAGFRSRTKPAPLQGSPRRTPPHTRLPSPSCARSSRQGVKAALPGLPGLPGREGGPRCPGRGPECRGPGRPKPRNHTPFWGTDRASVSGPGLRGCIHERARAQLGGGGAVQAEDRLPGSRAAQGRPLSRLLAHAGPPDSRVCVTLSLLR